MSEAELHALEVFSSKMMQVKEGDSTPKVFREAFACQTMGRLIFNLVQDFKYLELNNRRLEGENKELRKYG